MSDEKLSNKQIEEFIIYEPIPSDPESEDELEAEEEIGSGESLSAVGLEELNFFEDLPDEPAVDNYFEIDNDIENAIEDFVSVNSPQCEEQLQESVSLLDEPSTSQSHFKRKRGRKPNEKKNKPTENTKKRAKLVKFGPPPRPGPTWDVNEENIPSMAGTVSGHLGVSEAICMAEDKSPCALFKTMFSEEIIENVVFQTNLYAEQSGKRYKPTNKEEIHTFFGINILMGIKRLPSYRDYWSSDIDLNDPFISKLMPVNRFSWLLGNVHLNNNSLMPKKGEPGFDKLYKLRPFLTALSQNFKNNFHPGQILAVDESMIKFKGRSSLKQYMPKKPIKRGYKLWMLADKSGYVVKFEVYTGKVSDMRELDLGGSVVKRLTEELVGKHHSVYIDNFFVNYFLMEDLKDNDIYACGTIRVDRKYLPSFKPTSSMERGENEWFVSNNKVIATKWIDNKPVYVLSNFHDPNEVTTVKRREKDGSRVTVSCPVAISDYNKHMNCVDRFDQMKAVYQISRKSKKWWHRIFFFFVDAAVVNAFVIHNCLPTERLDLKTFRRHIVFGLVGKSFAESSVPRLSLSGPSPKPSNWKPKVHLEIRKAGSSHQPKRGTRRRCALCSTKKKQVSTNWQCSVCNVPLCLSKNKDCFQKFHK